MSKSEHVSKALEQPMVNDIQFLSDDEDVIERERELHDENQEVIQNNVINVQSNVVHLAPCNNTIVKRSRSVGLVSSQVVKNEPQECSFEVASLPGKMGEDDFNEIPAIQRLFSMRKLELEFFMTA